MIVYDLECRPLGHRFEGWFGSSDDFANQQARGLISCPNCGSSDVTKAVMAPAVGRKGNQVANVRQPAPNVAGGVMPAEARQVLEALAALQAEALKGSSWVGDNFAEKSRAMHYGEAEAETIHGKASLDEAKELIEEGIAVLPLPFLVVPPEQAN